MTGASESSDPADPDVAWQPRVVLDADGLDRLELVLGGWLPSSAIADLAAADDAVLTDAENTPLARVSRAGGANGHPDVQALQAFATGSGPHWDPDARLSLAAARAATPGAGGGGTVVLIVDDPPTRSETDAMLAIAAIPEAATAVVVAAVRRRTAPGQVGPAGVTRAAWGFADTLATARPGLAIVRLVLPWPIGARVDLAPALAGLGSVMAPSDLHLPRLVGGDVETDYPAASAREVLRAREAGADTGGAVVFLTGLSGSGKSTIARALADELEDEGPRHVTLLDGDEVRQHLSRGLGFDAGSREINVDRIAWVASLVAEHGGIAVAAPIAPFAAGRRNARTMAERHGAFLLVWVSTPLAACEARDRKGLYARARAGEVSDFTGISSPYEEPDDADVVIDTTDVDVPEAVRRIREALEAKLGGPAAG